VNSGRTVFSQLIQNLPEKEFQKCVARYNGDSNFRGFSCWDQLLAMAFAQLTYRESLGDIESCLRALQSKLYHMGSAAKCRARRWPMPTNHTIGESLRSSLKY
jgi:hypothetical protein